VSSLGRELLLDCLTLHDIRELADFELPTIPDTTKFGVRGEREVDVSPGSLPRDLYLASLFAQAFMIFVLVYFNAFAREAVSSANFPAGGDVVRCLFEIAVDFGRIRCDSVGTISGFGSCRGLIS
jgi:hypothetical protein